MPLLRATVRAIILDEDDRVPLCRFVAPHPAVPDLPGFDFARAPYGAIQRLIEDALHEVDFSELAGEGNGRS